MSRTLLQRARTYVETCTDISNSDPASKLLADIDAALSHDKHVSLTFEQLRSANVARDKEWDPNNQITIWFRALELGGEAGEMLNIVKKLVREKLGLKGSRTTKAALAAELADIVICADLCAMEEGIDLGQAIIDCFNRKSKENGHQTLIEEG